MEQSAVRRCTGTGEQYLPYGRQLQTLPAEALAANNAVVISNVTTSNAVGSKDTDSQHANKARIASMQRWQLKTIVLSQTNRAWAY